MGIGQAMFAQLQLPTDLGTDSVQRLARSAFRDGDPVALKEAHRSLYAIYADRVWRPTAGREGALLMRCRQILEAGFREQLERTREEAGVDLTPPESDHAAWFESLAL